MRGSSVQLEFANKVYLTAFVIALLIAGCGGGGIGGGDSEIVIYDPYHGSEGLRISYLQNSPPRQLNSEQPFRVGVQVYNAGAFDVEDSSLFLTFNGADMQLESDPKTAILLGKSEFVRDGETDIIYWTGTTKRKMQDIDSEIGVLAFYRYQTNMFYDLCIDPDRFGIKMDKTCTTPESVSLRPQGAPVAVSSLLIDMYPETESAGEIENTKQKTIELTPLGKEVANHKIDTELVERITSSMLKNGSWKDKTFRRYDVGLQVPKSYPGRRHFVNQAIEYVKKIWVELGFQEMQGPLVQVGFWNFDALFTAQDHPVRDMQDTYYIKSPNKGKLVKPRIVQQVKKTHEDGWTTGSKGWRYRWDAEEAKRNVLRTHTTCLSARYISNLKKSDLPAKFFAVGKNFRNETLDWSHLFELIQVEGIVVDPDANLRNLVGYLKEFFLKMGYPKVRVRPGYFPYTEPSAEVDVFHPVHKKWVELGGSGIFRPEMTKPLFGTEVPVLAWGLGFDRTIMEYYGLTDIRDMYKNDIKQLREMKLWLK
jgi:phenylalanyl-tRNA synthetase alpha subunit